MTRKILWTMLLMGFVNSLMAADPWIGVWKLNTSKSTFAPGREMKEVTITVVAQGDDAFVTVKSVNAAGTESTAKYSVPFKGGTAKFTLGGPPPGSFTAKRIDAHNIEFTTTINGKHLETMREVLSENGKSITESREGIDGTGKPYKTVGVYDRQ
ncbi:MAG: hypothetical protein JSU00_26895 [Acidobacteria bacterium]|nr:hypothetical protein [Acidobacteriota bacterium]